MANDGLRYPKGNNDQRENHVDEKEVAQFGLGIEQGVSHKKQRDVIKKELQAQNAVHQVCRRWIKDLHDSEPDKEKDGHEEGRSEGRDFFSSIGQEKREIDDSSQNILGEIDDHVVAEVFSEKILKQEPRQEKIEAVPPVVEHGDDKGTAGKRQSNKGKIVHVAGDDVAGNFVGRHNRENQEAEDKKWTSAKLERPDL